MDDILLGQYVPGQSFLHRLDPRSKMITVTILVWLVFLLKNPAEYATFVVFVILAYLTSGVARSFWKSLKPGFYLVIFTIILNAVFTPGEVLLSMGILKLSREGLIQGLTMGLRLLLLISLSSLVTLTTSPVRMTEGLEQLMTPLKKVNFPASELAMMMNIALRFIPTFWEEWDKIRKAQLSRGADFESWNPASRIKYVTAMLIPLFVSAFRKADELSTAMEARGYVVGAPRTSLNVLKFNSRDYVLLISVMVLSSVFVAYRADLLW
ncbi:MAG TPA: energy-coupling factor transporter transmembrane component T [Desulfobacteria bacterium]|nr:energy-coupling factor transporter transmembrane component T [Desulfobacteria bacterium]